MTIENICERFRTRLITELESAGDNERAKGQQSYMRSSLPYYGVRVPEVRRIVRTIARELRFENAATWEATILLLWRQAEKREERTAAVELLVHPSCHKWLTPDRIALVEELVATGAWWDFVDAIAAHGIGAMLANHPVKTAQILRLWANDENCWKRRSAILSQLRHKQDTDHQLLFDVIAPSVDSKEIFLRKAIGWALREYAKIAPQVVVAYIEENAHRLSGLSKREALKTLLKQRVVTTIP